MNYCKPEEVGISSEKILEYIKILQDHQLSIHNIIISKGDNIVFEKYWAPYHADYKHRMYSASKSFVSIAIGFLEQDGLIQLDDPICKYFPKELENQPDEYMRNQTIRHMLMMSTAKPHAYWFDARPTDRVAAYFANTQPYTRPSGTIFEYDTNGSFVLGALVERLVGKPFMEYLQEKLFCKIGVSKDAYCLKCPGGHSWGDSAVMCTGMDFWKTARFTLNKGKWNGEQILNEKYIVDATSKQIIEDDILMIAAPGEYSTFGYGYQFWRARDNSYYFNGAGCQFAFCSPDSDMIMVCNADTQGVINAKSIVMNNYFDLVENTAKDEPLPDNPAAYQRLMDETKDLKLAVLPGEYHSDTAKEISGLTYTLNENPMGITKMQITFEGNRGVLKYTNAQGDKEIAFGMGYNEFGLFPEDGYSDEVASVPAPGNKYKCASSGTWLEERKLYIKVQIIDKYLGSLQIVIGFKKDGFGMFMRGVAEDFLLTYTGFAAGEVK